MIKSNNKNLVLRHDFIYYFLQKSFEERTNEELVEIRNILEVLIHRINRVIRFLYSLRILSQRRLSKCANSSLWS